MLRWRCASQLIVRRVVEYTASKTKPKTIKICIHNFPAQRSTLKRKCEASTVSGRWVGAGQVVTWQIKM